MRRWVAAAIVAIVGCFVAFIVLRSGSASPVDIKGFAAAPQCAGGYQIENANVELRNERDEVVGAGSTSTDVLDRASGTLCMVSFVIAGVPESSFYEIRVGSHEGPTFSRERLEADGWVIDLSVGGAVLPSSEDHCLHAQELSQALFDTRTLNRDLPAWQRGLSSSMGALVGDAANLVREGSPDLASDITQSVAPLRALERLEPDFDIDDLNRAVAASNELMPDVVSDCVPAQSWTEVSYEET